ncbi:MAG: hypothetical protein PHE61_08320 [Candidatus Omnitrophica bacterium]|nr:hypothetical protein [Candidatus Omnitrophota bacterium]
MKSRGVKSEARRSFIVKGLFFLAGAALAVFGTKSEKLFGGGDSLPDLREASHWKKLAG